MDDDDAKPPDGRQLNPGQLPAPPPRQEPVSPRERRSVLPEQPLKIAEVARYFRVSERTIRRWIKNGTLIKEPGFDRTVRISVDQIHQIKKGAEEV